MRRSRLHARARALLAATDHPIPALLATHARAAGPAHTGETIRWAMAAAAESAARRAPDSALQWWRFADDAERKAPVPDAVRRVTVLLGLGRAQLDAGDASARSGPAPTLCGPPRRWATVSCWSSSSSTPPSARSSCSADSCCRASARSAGPTGSSKGLLFACYHLHEPWVIPQTLLVDTFAEALPSRRYRSSLIGIAVHSGQTLFFFVIALMLVLP